MELLIEFISKYVEEHTEEFEQWKESKNVGVEESSPRKG